VAEAVIWGNSIFARGGRRYELNFRIQVSRDAQDRR
jgi:hypothetical protein